ncbi:MAG: hypothetical protein ACKOBW_10100 [Planctomycetota bacterium]
MRLGSMLLTACLALPLYGVAYGTAACAADGKPEPVQLADGKLVVTAPGSWVRKQPKSRIIEHEFAIPPAEGDKQEGRFTVMGAGGGVEANIERWVGQFTQPDGGATKDKTKIQKLKVGGVDVHYVDISGTYKDQPGPVAPAVMRENYRMLAAIIVTEKQGMHFLKFYGPKATVAGQEKAFQEMVNSLKAQ